MERRQDFDSSFDSDNKSRVIHSSPSVLLSSLSPSVPKDLPTAAITTASDNRVFGWLPGQNLHRRDSLSPHLRRRSLSQSRINSCNSSSRSQSHSRPVSSNRRRQRRTPPPQPAIHSSNDCFWCCILGRGGPPSQLSVQHHRHLYTDLATGSDDTDQNSQHQHSNLLQPVNVIDHIYWRRPVTLLEDVLTQIHYLLVACDNKKKNTKNDIHNMGGCVSNATGGGRLIEQADGGEEEFQNRFLEDRVLGEGEFGVVTLVHDMTSMNGNGNNSNRDKAGTVARGGAVNGMDGGNNTFACKCLRKGVQFKDNTIYPPLNPKVLKGEVEMLRQLAGKHYCLRLVGVYETPRVIYIVTDFCGGGDLIEYVSKQEEELRTDDVSRISFQLLDAVDHCARHNIIHRDIKAENLMFTSPTPGSDMKLIDFGSGTNEVVEGNHTTFAGSAFYISPEMYQRTYTTKTDVWSAGVTLYVLVAGYPADKLQKAFNLLQQSQRNLKDLPNLPEDMPDSFYNMLEGLLVYKHKGRKSAGELIDHEFVQFHKAAFSIENVMMEAAQGPPSKDNDRNKSKTMSVAIRGSVSRHSMFLDYQKFERSLTALMATLMTKKDLLRFVDLVRERMSEQKAAGGKEIEEATKETKQEEKKTLDIVKIRDMKSILLKDGQDELLEAIDKLPGGSSYDAFAYDVGVLLYFLGDGNNPGGTYRSQTGSQMRRSSGGSLRGSFRSARGSFRGKSLFKRRNSGPGSSNYSNFSGSGLRTSKGESSMSNSRGRAKDKTPAHMKRSRSR